MAKDYAMLIFTDAKANNNKFYELILNDDDSISLSWGRVGSSRQKKTTYGGAREFMRIMNSKTSKGYERTQTVNINSNSQSTTKVALKEAAKRDLLGLDNLNNVQGLAIKKEDVEISVSLIERLTEINRHQLTVASGGNIKIDDSGLITTPLGMVTGSTINEARKLLIKLDKYVQKQDYVSDSYIQNLEQYLKLIPQKVPHRRGWYESFFTNFSSLIAQGSLLDQLESSIDLYKIKEKEAIEEMKSNSNEIKEKLFNTQIQLVTDKKIIKSIEEMFENSVNRRHVSSHLKLKNVYELRNADALNRFDKMANKIGNVKRLWHGTRAFNVLSILKSGLIIPKSGGSYHITGRMFGNGIYFSDQSTKALNYSYGYWDGGSRDNNCFMFVSDVAMGREFSPNGYGGYSNFDPKKHNCDSLFAKAGVSGVMNNEMIVYDLDQVFLRYLCEFSV